MWVLPYEKFTIDTKLDIDEAIDRMARSVYPKRRNWSLTWHRERGFEGHVSSSGFTINRIIRYRNSFLPYAHGRIERTNDGRARILVRITLHPLVMVFGLLLLVPMVIGLIQGLVTLLRTGTEGMEAMAGSLGGLAMLYVLVMLGWAFEVARLRRFLLGLYRPGYRA